MNDVCSSRPISGYGAAKMLCVVLGCVTHAAPLFAHVNHGVGCAICHGRVERMEVVAPAVSFDMRWCLECHRDPARFLRPRDQVMNMAWQPAANQRVLGQRLLVHYGIETTHLMDCATCHR